MLGLNRMRKSKEHFQSPFEPYKVTSPFGERVHPVTGIKGFHYGLDMAPKEKRKDVNICAICDGEIVGIYPIKESEDIKKQRFGNWIVQLYENGKDLFFIYYTHLGMFNPDIKVGMIIKRGSYLGIMGASGRSTGKHLHLQVMKDKCENSRAFDPLTLIA